MTQDNLNIQDGRGRVLRQLLQEEVRQQVHDQDPGHHGHRRGDVLREVRIILAVVIIILTIFSNYYIINYSGTL